MYLNKHNIWIRAITAAVVCLFLVNDISWAGPDGISGKSTLAVPSQLNEEEFKQKAEIKAALLMHPAANEALHEQIMLDKEIYGDGWEGSRTYDLDFNDIDIRGNIITRAEGLGKFKLVKVSNLFRMSGQLAHVGLSGRYKIGDVSYDYGMPVIYVDAQYYIRADKAVLRHEVDELIQWEDLRSAIAEAYDMDRSQVDMCEWIKAHISKSDEKLNGTEYQGLSSIQIAERIHKASWSLEELYYIIDIGNTERIARHVDYEYIKELYDKYRDEAGRDVNIAATPERRKALETELKTFKAFDYLQDPKSINGKTWQVDPVTKSSQMPERASYGSYVRIRIWNRVCFVPKHIFHAIKIDRSVHEEVTLINTNNPSQKIIIRRTGANNFTLMLTSGAAPGEVIKETSIELPGSSGALWLGYYDLFLHFEDMVIGIAGITDTEEKEHRVAEWLAKYGFDFREKAGGRELSKFAIPEYLMFNGQRLGLLVGAKREKREIYLNIYTDRLANPRFIVLEDALNPSVHLVITKDKDGNTIFMKTGRAPDAKRSASQDIVSLREYEEFKDFELALTKKLEVIGIGQASRHGEKPVSTISILEGNQKGIRIRFASNSELLAVKKSNLYKVRPEHVYRYPVLICDPDSISREDAVRDAPEENEVAIAENVFSGDVPEFLTFFIDGRHAYFVRSGRMKRGDKTLYLFRPLTNLKYYDGKRASGEVVTAICMTGENSVIVDGITWKPREKAPSGYVRILGPVINLGRIKDRYKRGGLIEISGRIMGNIRSPAYTSPGTYVRPPITEYRIAGDISDRHLEPNGYVGNETDRDPADNDAYWEYNSDFEEQKKADPQPDWLFKKIKQMVGVKVRALDIGCGSGRSIARMMKMGFTDVEGMDISPRSIDMAKKKNIPGNKLKIANIRTADLEGRYKFILASDILLYMHRRNELPDVMNKIVNALEPGGVLALRWASGKDKIRDTGDRYMYPASRQFLMDLMKQYNMEVVDIELREEPVYVDSGENKTCDYWYVVARKPPAVSTAKKEIKGSPAKFLEMVRDNLLEKALSVAGFTLKDMAPYKKFYFPVIDNNIRTLIELGILEKVVSAGRAKFRFSAAIRALDAKHAALLIDVINNIEYETRATKHPLQYKISKKRDMLFVKQLVRNVIDIEKTQYLTDILPQAVTGEGKYYTVRYNAVKLKNYAIRAGMDADLFKELLEMYVRMLKVRLGAEERVELKPSGSTWQPLISVECYNGRAKTGDPYGKGNVNIEAQEIDRNSTLRIIDMANMAFAVANIPIGSKEGELDQYSRLISFIQSQYRGLTGKEISLAEILHSNRMIILPAIRPIPFERLKEYYEFTIRQLAEAA